MRYVLPVAAVFIAAPGIAAAQEISTECTLGDLTRRVVIMSEPGVSVPCEVHYYKDTEAPGESQVLWSAQAQEGFCEEKAAGFVAQLEGWGWNCGAGSMPEPPTPPTMDGEPAPEAPSAPALDGEPAQTG